MSDKCIVCGCLNRKHQGDFISGGITDKGGVNTNPSAALSRPAPPQPYKPQSSGEIEYGETFVHRLLDRIEQLAAVNGELEAKLQAAVEDKIDVVLDLTYLKAHLEDFFAILETTEQKDDGRYFHPTTIRSSRALDAERLEKILAELKRIITANDKSDG